MVVALSLCALNMCVGFELIACPQRIDRTGFRQFGDSPLALELAEAFDSELEELAEPRAFWLRRKVWRGIWDDFRNWLIHAA